MQAYFWYIIIHLGFVKCLMSLEILISGICRDVEHALPNMKSNVEALGSCFEDYRVVLYENNSQDRTVEMLKCWSLENDKVLVKSETWERFFSSRTETIAKARNCLLDWIEELHFEKEYKILVMMDFDFLSSFPIDEIVKSIQDPRDWDAICANGIYSVSDPFYWDRYAFRNLEFPYGPEVIGDSWWWHDVYDRIYFREDDWIPVFSAFGGFAIYKTKDVLECRYSGIVTEDVKRFYKEILGKEVFFFPNTYWEHPLDLDLLTCCEHIPFYASMREKGYDRIFINPKLKIDYAK